MKRVINYESELVNIRKRLVQITNEVNGIACEYSNRGDEETACKIDTPLYFISGTGAELDKAIKSLGDLKNGRN